MTGFSPDPTRNKIETHTSIEREQRRKRGEINRRWLPFPKRSNQVAVAELTYGACYATAERMPTCWAKSNSLPEENWQKAERSQPDGQISVTGPHPEISTDLLCQNESPMQPFCSQSRLRTIPAGTAKHSAETYASNSHFENSFPDTLDLFPAE